MAVRWWESKEGERGSVCIFAYERVNGETERHEKEQQDNHHYSKGAREVENKGYVYTKLDQGLIRNKGFKLTNEFLDGSTNAHSQHGPQPTSYLPLFIFPSR